jgi:hypothetical protein
MFAALENLDSNVDVKGLGKILEKYKSYSQRDSHL